MYERQNNICKNGTDSFHAPAFTSHLAYLLWEKVTTLDGLLPLFATVSSVAKVKKEPERLDFWLKNLAFSKILT
jgi:hypothetical protein